MKEKEQTPDTDKRPREALSADAIRVALKEAKDLARALEGTATTHIHVKAGGVEIEIERSTAAIVASAGPVVELARTASLPPSNAPGVVPICSPLVGVFYRALSPGAKPFVQVGDTVERGQKVCIVEAMKIMNEVTSDCRGVVVEILVEDSTAVAYEQRLMLVDTTGGGSSK